MTSIGDRVMENYIEKQLNGGKNGELNKLFDQWLASYADVPDAKDRFCPDGLVVKCKGEESGYDINREWERAARRIMFIVKDCPDGWGYDTRRLLVGYEGHEKSQENAWKVRNLKGRTGFFKNIARLLHGLHYMTEENMGKELNDQAYDDASIIQTFNEVPFAYVEAKKLAGGKSCSPAHLRKVLERDGAFLAREIEILHPNIIVCCDQNGDIFNSVVKNCFQGRVPDEDARWDYVYEFEDGNRCDFGCKLYYYKEGGVLLFQSYHPTRLGKAEWKIYEKVLSPFRRFFHACKTFDTVNRKE